MYDFRYMTGHRYSLSATGMKFKSKDFSSREAAQKEMFDFLDKNGIGIEEVWDDGHFKTYCCGNGAKIYISRI